MLIRNISLLSLIALVVFFSSQTFAEKTAEKKAENAKYIIKTQIADQQLIIRATNKENKKNIELKKTTLFLKNIKNLSFVNKNSFLAVGDMTGVGQAILLASIFQDKIELDAEFRTDIYLLNNDKNMLVFSDWAPCPTCYPTYVMSVDLTSGIYSQKILYEKSKPIFDVRTFKNISQNLGISALIWGSKDKEIFILCDDSKQLRKNYLFKYNFLNNTAKLLLKIDKDPSVYFRKEFKWNENERVVEIIYSERNGKKDYIYKARN